MNEETDEIEFVLGTRFEGIEDAREYARVMGAAAAAEEKFARALRDSNREVRQRFQSFQTARNRSQGSRGAAAGGSGDEDAQPSAVRRFSAARSSMSAASGPDRESVAAPAKAGPFERVNVARRALADAEKKGVSGDRLDDLKYQYFSAQESARRASQRMTPTSQPGVSPLLGRALGSVVGKDRAAAFLAGAGRLASGAGPIGIALTGLVKIGEASAEAVGHIKEMADSAALSAQRMTDARASLGSSTGRTADLMAFGRILGVDASQAAPAFGQRIASDPSAMSNAARLGVANPAGRYGSRDFGQMYQQAIENAARIEDRRRRLQVSDSLGITQEVERMRLLSPNSIARTRFGAGVSAQINDPRREREAANFQAANENFAQARQNFADALGGSFLPIATEVLNGLADTLNFGATVINTIDKYLSPLNAFIRTIQGVRDRIRGKMDPSSVIGPQGSIAPNDLAARAGRTFDRARADIREEESDFRTARSKASRAATRNPLDVEAPGREMTWDRVRAKLLGTNGTGMTDEDHKAMMDRSREHWRRALPSETPAPIGGWDTRTSGLGGYGESTTLSSNTEALMANTEAIAKLNRDMVNSRVKNSLPGELGGIGLSRAIGNNQLALGPMGRN